MGAELILVPYSEQEGSAPIPAPLEAQFSSQKCKCTRSSCPLQTSCNREARTGVRAACPVLRCCVSPRLWKICCKSGVGLRVCRSHSSRGCIDFWSGFEDHTLSSWGGEAPGEIPGAPGSLPEGPTAGGTVTQLPCVCKPSSRMCVYVCMCVCMHVHTSTYQSTSMYVTPLLLVRVSDSLAPSLRVSHLSLHLTAGCSGLECSMSVHPPVRELCWAPRCRGSGGGWWKLLCGRDRAVSANNWLTAGYSWGQLGQAWAWENTLQVPTAGRGPHSEDGPTVPHSMRRAGPEALGLPARPLS